MIDPIIWAIFSSIIIPFSFLLCVRFGGIAAGYIYSSVAVIVANIAVLKTTYMWGYSVALGTVIFSSVFLATDLLNEVYGRRAAYTNIGLSFLGYAVFSLLMTSVRGYEAAEETQHVHHSLDILFSLSPAILLSSLCAYAFSQSCNIIVYRGLMICPLWVRSAVSTVVGSFLDNALFSLLVWRIFSKVPLPFGYIWRTYIVSVFLGRIVLSLWNIPFMYLGKRWVKP